jgi:UPF0716 family protein affecting phage T7 exclusion
MAIAGGMLIQPGIVSDALGLALGGLVYMIQRHRAGRRQTLPEKDPSEKA